MPSWWQIVAKHYAELKLGGVWAIKLFRHQRRLLSCQQNIEIGLPRACRPKR
ncbi:hypothetical protein KCP73_10380 [Salmonella enterica subsp. enterica]|nr:hypothetical protein KCP73_10380 [Salmonella enterica subsp. enterica]